MLQNSNQSCWQYRIPWLEHTSLWMITDILSARGRALSDIAVDGIRGGVDVVVVRLKGLDMDFVKHKANAVAEVCEKMNTPWVLSHNVELVGELKPDGVQLGKSDPPVNEVRLMVGDETAIGYSAHTVEEIAFAAGLGADYCWFSPIFDTRKGDSIVKGIGLDAVKQANIAADAIGKAGNPFPVVFLGGITPDNAELIVRCGGARIAAISALCGSDDIENVARLMKTKLAKE